MTYLTPIYDPVYDPIGGDIEPGAPASASFGAAQDLALFDAYSRAVIGASRASSNSLASVTPRASKM